MTARGAGWTAPVQRRHPPAIARVLDQCVDFSAFSYRIISSCRPHHALPLVDLYHWSSAKFSSTWYDTLSVLVAKGRARVSVAASEADWSKRIREMQYADYEDHTVGS